MYFNDHQPPHFHAYYGDDEALVDIESLEVRRGSLPRRAVGLVAEWASQHREELRRDWELARNGVTPDPISPLE